MDLNDDEDVLEMGADGLWGEGQSARLLEHDRHNVVTDVSLPQQLERKIRDRHIDFTPPRRNHTQFAISTT